MPRRSDAWRTYAIPCCGMCPTQTLFRCEAREEIKKANTHTHHKHTPTSSITCRYGFRCVISHKNVSNATTKNAKNSQKMWIFIWLVVGFVFTIPVVIIVCWYNFIFISHLTTRFSSERMQLLLFTLRWLCPFSLHHSLAHTHTHTAPLSLPLFRSHPVSRLIVHCSPKPNAVPQRGLSN